MPQYIRKDKLIRKIAKEKNSVGTSRHEQFVRNGLRKAINCVNTTTGFYAVPVYELVKVKEELALTGEVSEVGLHIIDELIEKYRR